MSRMYSNIAKKALKKMLGKVMVLKQYKSKLVITKYPDMSDVKPSQKQKEKRSKFKEAVQYAKSITQDPAAKKIYQKKIKSTQTVYHFAISEYLLNH